MHRFLDHYRAVRQTLREELALLSLNAESRIALFGTGELAELVYICIRELGIEEIDIYSHTHDPDRRFLGHQIMHIGTLKSDDYDRVLLADFSVNKSEEMELLTANLPSDKLVYLFSVNHIYTAGHEG